MAAPKVVFPSVGCKDFHHQYQAATTAPTCPLTTSSGGDTLLFSRPPPFSSQEGRHVEESESWQELAFDQDSRSVSGGVWPPRFYACGFCRRKFRSAQALGGHMNVHRRDRFRLRQSPFLLGDTIPCCTNSINSPLATITPSTTLCLLYPAMPKVSPSSTFLAALHTPSRNDLFLTSSVRSTSPLPAASKTKDKTRCCNPSIDSNSHKNKMQKRASETYQYSPQNITENSDIHSEESSRFCSLDLELRLGQSNCRKSPC